MEKIVSWKRIETGHHLTKGISHLGTSTRTQFRHDVNCLLPSIVLHLFESVLKWHSEIKCISVHPSKWARFLLIISSSQSWVIKLWNGLYRIWEKEWTIWEREWNICWTSRLASLRSLKKWNWRREKKRWKGKGLLYCRRIRRLEQDWSGTYVSDTDRYTRHTQKGVKSKCAEANWRLFGNFVSSSWDCSWPGRSTVEWNAPRWSTDPPARLGIQSADSKQV